MKQHLAALWWAVRVEVSIRRRPLIELCRTSGIELQERPDLGERPQAPLRLSPHDVRTLMAVRRVYRRWPFGQGSCLRECLVAGRLLRYRAPSLRVGVKRSTSGLEMHAWLDLDGAALDPEHAGYLPFVGGSRLA